MTLTLADKRKRAHAIGASEAWKVVLRQGIHDVYLRLVHPELLVPEGKTANVLGRRGHALEPFVAQLYAEKTKLALQTSRTLRHPLHPFLVATPDRVVFDPNPGRRDDGGPMPPLPIRNVQIKAVTYFAKKRDGWGEPGSQDFPLRFRIQCTLEAAVLGGVPSDLVALVDGEDEIRIYPVPFDGELAKLVIEELSLFFTMHVLTREPPPPDGSAQAAEYLAKRYPVNKGNLLPATVDDEKLGNELREIRAAMKRLEAREKELENWAKARTGEADGVEKQWTWKLPSNGRGRVGWQAVAEEIRHELGLARVELQLRGERLNELTDDTLATPTDPWPEIVGRHTSPPSRTFRLLGAKESTP